MTITNVSYYRYDPKESPVLKQIEPPEPLANGLFGKKWHDQAILKLRSWDLKIDGLMDKNSVQKAADLFADKFGKSLAQMQTYLMKEFAPLVQFNALLEKYGRGEWYQQFAVFLIQLPFKAARNIVRMFYSLLETACYTAAHPIKGLNHIAKQLTTIAYECTKVQTWSQMGAGMVAANLGQAACGNPISILGFVVGSILLIDFTIAHLIIAVFDAKDGEEWKAFKQAIVSHMKALSETAATGFAMGVITGAIQQAVLKYKKAAYAKTYARCEFESKLYAEQFIKENRLPAYTKMQIENGKILLEWSGKELEALHSSYPDFWTRPDSVAWTKHASKLDWISHSERAASAFDPGVSVKIELQAQSSKLWLTKIGDSIRHATLNERDEIVGHGYVYQYDTYNPSLESAGMHTTGSLPANNLLPLPKPLAPTLATPIAGAAAGLMAAKNKI